MFGSLAFPGRAAAQGMNNLQETTISDLILDEAKKHKELLQEEEIEINKSIEVDKAHIKKLDLSPEQEVAFWNLRQLENHLGENFRLLEIEDPSRFIPLRNIKVNEDHILAIREAADEYDARRWKKPKTTSTPLLFQPNIYTFLFMAAARKAMKGGGRKRSRRRTIRKKKNKRSKSRRR